MEGDWLCGPYGSQDLFWGPAVLDVFDLSSHPDLFLLTGRGFPGQTRILESNPILVLFVL